MPTTGDFLKATHKESKPSSKPLRLNGHALSQRVSFDKAVIASHENWQLWVDNKGDLHIAPFPFEVTSPDLIYISSSMTDDDGTTRSNSPRITSANNVWDLLEELSQRPMEIVSTSPFAHVKVTG